MAEQSGLTGERVRLRELREDDLPLLIGWWNDPEVASLRGSGPEHPRPYNVVAEMFRSRSENSGPGVGLCIVTLDGDELAGRVSLFNVDARNRCATLGIVIGPPFQNRGLGTDAVRTVVRYGFRELGLHRIELSVNSFNARAIAAYLKAGFVEEGRRRQAVLRLGQWHDSVQMGLLHDEWDAAVPQPTP
jgi:RimJ/RimL family protein N-acetyltransferase